MNLFKKKMAGGLVLALLFSSGGMTAQAQETDMPLMMTLKTNIFGYQGPTNSFTLYLGSTQENVEVYVESPTAKEYVTVNPWSLGQDEEGSNAAIATAIPLSVTQGDNEVRIYGDKSKIDFIDAHGCYLNSLELNGEFPNLTVIDLSHNELTAIDLSNQINLASIDLLDNAFRDASKMVIGTNHPGLMILSVGINDVIDPQLDLKNFPQLQYFSARNNYGVYDVDPTGCPNLVSLVLEITNVSSIDVSKNLNLDVLNLSQTRVKSVDVSKNTKLGELYINHEGSFNNEDQYRVTSIDLSKNPNIEYLDLGGNALTEIDLSNNPYIKLLYLQRNHLSSIDISNLTGLSILSLAYNDMNFATLPIPNDKWSTYYYYQAPLQTELKYKVGQPIDFSSQVIRAPYKDEAGNTITPKTYANVFGLKSGSDNYEVDQSKYTFDNGVLTFKEAISDPVFVEFFCDVFEEYTLSTQSFMVKTVEDFDAPSAVFSFTPSNTMAGKQISLSLGAGLLSSSINYPADLTVFIGDSKTELKGVVTGSSMPSSPNVTFTLPATVSPVTLALPDGFSVTSVGIDGVELVSIDLSPSEGLQNLSITNCGLSTIDLAYNRELRNLDLSGNVLRTLDLAGIRGDYQKFDLANINLSNNKLVALETVSAATIYNLNLSNNLLSSFDMKYYTGLQTIDLSNNRLTGTLDFSTVEKIRNINISGNQVNALVFNTEEEEALDALTNVNLSNNNLTLATLPMFNNPGINYIYAPQNTMEVLSTAPAINLSAQNIVVNGVGTTYTWKYEDGATLPATEYSNDGGATVFNETLVGSKVYCEMTNPAFPAFNTTPLTTSVITVASRPNVLLGSFVTKETGTAEIGFVFNKSGDNAVYIDWRGDGSEYEPYLYEANKSYPSIYRTGNTFAGAEAKIYSYDPATTVSVFALNHTPLTSMDLSPMTQLEAADIHNAGLTDGSLILPESSKLRELVLDGNAFETETFSQCTNVSNLNLANNQYTTVDLSAYPNVVFAELSDNKISSVKFGNNSRLYQLKLTNNNLKTIDLEGAKGVQELALSSNQLSKVDLTPIVSSLRVLEIAGNRMTFASLQEMVAPATNLTYLDYSNQKPMEVQCWEYKIDLSSQAMINGVPTNYYWFLGDNQNDVYYDYNMEAFVGEYLEGPEDSADPEYTIENGVTTFLYDQSRSVICAMTNSSFPNLILYTAPTKVSGAGIEALFSDKDGLVDVVTLSGVIVKSKVNISEALQGLQPGIYIIGGKKVLVK